jgi:hypothetical protein
MIETKNIIFFIFKIDFDGWQIIGGLVDLFIWGFGDLGIWSQQITKYPNKQIPNHLNI